MSDKVVIRKVTPGDVPAILAIDARIVGRDRAASWQQRVYRYLEKYFPPVSHVAEVEGKVVGFILGDVRGWEYGLPSSGWIDIVGVLPEFQGQGIGGKLVEAFVQECFDRGMKPVHIMARLRDRRLQSFLRSLGFKRGQLVDYEKD